MKRNSWHCHAPNPVALLGLLTYACQANLVVASVGRYGPSLAASRVLGFVAREGAGPTRPLSTFTRQSTDCKGKTEKMMNDSRESIGGRCIFQRASALPHFAVWFE